MSTTGTNFEAAASDKFEMGDHVEHTSGREGKITAVTHYSGTEPSRYRIQFNDNPLDTIHCTHEYITKISPASPEKPRPPPGFENP